MMNFMSSVTSHGHATVTAHPLLVSLPSQVLRKVPFD